jgi:hypothetical protein
MSLLQVLQELQIGSTRHATGRREAFRPAPPGRIA